MHPVQHPKSGKDMSVSEPLCPLATAVGRVGPAGEEHGDPKLLPRVGHGGAEDDDRQEVAVGRGHSACGKIGRCIEPPFVAAGRQAAAGLLRRHTATIVGHEAGHAARVRISRRLHRRTRQQRAGGQHRMTPKERELLCLCRPMQPRHNGRVQHCEAREQRMAASPSVTHVAFSNTGAITAANSGAGIA